MEQKQKLKTCLMGLASGLSLIVCFCFISLVNASDEGLVAYYSFDDGSGNVLHDLSGNGNDGTIYGAKWVEGKYGKALEFDGINDYVEIPNDNALDITNKLTVEAWVKSSTSLNYRTVVSKGYDVKDGGFALRMTRDSEPISAFFQTHNTAGQLASVLKYNNIVNEQWFHVVGTYDGTNVRFYVNGLLDSAPKDLTGNIKSNSLPIRIGRMSTSTFATEYFKGSIDEVCIYNRALTEDEIKADMVSSCSEQTCSEDSECNSGYCVHGTCRLNSTYCDDNYCDSGEAHNFCFSDCGYVNDGTITIATVAILLLLISRIILALRDWRRDESKVHLSDVIKK